VLVLAIDTSSAAVTAAVLDLSADARYAEQVTDNARGHGEYLAPGIAACLAEVGAAPGDLRAIVAGTGPGPFTGLRVGLVTVAVMGKVLGIPTYGVCSLDAIAGAVASESPLLVATDARRKEIYWAHYVDGVRVDGPEVSHPADIRSEAVAMAGAGARLYADVLNLPIVGPDYPSAAALVRCAAERIRAGTPSETLTPLYLRRPDAVPPGSPKAVTQ
jgi:tRNA threonylcarbamoyl adenosine modification protein YeaZ